MAVAKSLGIREYCDAVYNELTGMKAKLQELIEQGSRIDDAEQVASVVKTHGPHLQDIMGMIDWKMQILTKACPADWTRYPEGAEREVSVKEPEGAAKESVPPGELGG